MATSGSVNYTLTTQQIITEALQLLGVYGPYDTVEAEDYATCLVTLNTMVKAWQSQGLHLWKQREAVIFLNAGQSKYVLGGTSPTPDKASEAIYKTELSADEAAAQTTISIDDSTDMTASDIIGIELDDGTLHWSTISSVPDSTSVIINDALPSAAAADNNVYWYTTAIGKPFDISSVRLLRDSDTETVLWPVSRQVYFNIPNKTTSSTPNQYFVDRQKDQTHLYIYPTSDTVSSRLRITYTRLIEDFDDSVNEADFPQEWLGVITYNLAVAVASKYSKEDKAAKVLAPLANAYLKGLKDWDNEHTSMTIGPRLG